MWKHDLGWWGFVLAIATLILAYPLDVLAHLTTPLLKNWWASRSRLTLEERIKSLKAELGLMEMNPAMSETEDMILTSAQVTHVLIWSLGYILVGGSFALDEGGKKSILSRYTNTEECGLQGIVGNSPQRSSTSKTS